jgi:hypothetical protein
MKRKKMNNENQAKTQPGAGGLQRPPGSGQSNEREQNKNALRKERQAIKEGHATGGYCQTEKLHAVEKKLHAILTEERDQAVEDGDKPTAKTTAHELAGFSYAPRLVVAPD